MSTDTPSQWRMVPVEPTPEMIKAGITAWVHSAPSRASNADGHEHGGTRAWKAALAASPQPAAAQPVAWRVQVDGLWFHARDREGLIQALGVKLGISDAGLTPEPLYASAAPTQEPWPGPPAKGDECSDGAAPTQAAQEPVAKVRCWEEPRYEKPPRQMYELTQLDGFRALPVGEHKLYSAPQAVAELVEALPLLTDERILDLPCGVNNGSQSWLLTFARAVESEVRAALSRAPGAGMPNGPVNLTTRAADEPRN